MNKGNLYKWCCNCWSLKYYGNRRCKLAKCRVFLHKQDLFPFPSLTIPSLFISPLMHTFPLFLYFQPFPNHFCYPLIEMYTPTKFRATQKYYYELMSKSDVIMFFLFIDTFVDLSQNCKVFCLKLKILEIVGLNWLNNFE